jgi:hypothetical protein
VVPRPSAQLRRRERGPVPAQLVEPVAADLSEPTPVTVRIGQQRRRSAPLQPDQDRAGAGCIDDSAQLAPGTAHSSLCQRKLTGQQADLHHPGQMVHRAHRPLDPVELTVE